MANIKFYLDEHMPRSVARELEKRGIEVIRAVEADMEGKNDDTEHLPFAAQQQAVLVTRDRPFAGRTQKHTDHAGLIYWTGKDNDIGGMVRLLYQFAQDYTAELVVGEVFWIP